MNISNFAHAGLALIAQFIVAFIAVQFFALSATPALIMGALLGSGFYWGREVAQNERKLGTPPWYSGFLIHFWSKDSVFDLLTPLFATIIVVVISCVL